MVSKSFEVEGGELVHAGYARVDLSNGTAEHIGFLGAGVDLVLTNVSLSHIATPGSFGIVGEGGFQGAAGGVGAYLNVHSVTDCIDHKGR